MPRPYVVLTVLFLLIVAVLGPRPKVVVVGSTHRAAAQTTPKPDWLPPSGQPGFAPGTPTFSATPLAWSHAQFIRLAWSISAGRPVEQPSIVACRYVRKCAAP